MLGNQPPGFIVLPTEGGTTARLLETTDAYLDRPSRGGRGGRGGPQVDHLAQLLRRQRRRRAVRRGLLWIGSWVPRRQRPATVSPPAPSTPAPVLPAPRPALDEVRLDRLTIDVDRSTAGSARGASSALGALPRQTGQGEHRRQDDRGARLS